MPRRKIIIKKDMIPDPKYNSVVVSKFISRMMQHGKRSVSTRLLYFAIERAGAKSKQDDVLAMFLKALENVKPMVEVKSRRVGGSTYQVPVEIRDSRREALAMRWLIQAARARSGKAMGERLADEIADAFNATGTAYKKKEDTHRMAEANKAFSHYRW